MWERILTALRNASSLCAFSSACCKIENFIRSVLRRWLKPMVSWRTGWEKNPSITIRRRLLPNHSEIAICIAANESRWSYTALCVGGAAQHCTVRNSTERICRLRCIRSDDVFWKTLHQTNVNAFRRIPLIKWCNVFDSGSMHNGVLHSKLNQKEDFIKNSPTEELWNAEASRQIVFSIPTIVSVPHRFPSKKYTIFSYSNFYSIRSIVSSTCT